MAKVLIRKADHGLRAQEGEAHKEMQEMPKTKCILFKILV